jgi:hypothetical protein
MCAFMHRSIPALDLARDMIRSGELGEIRHFRFRFLLNMLTGGPLNWRGRRPVLGPGASRPVALRAVGPSPETLARGTQGLAAITGRSTRMPRGLTEGYLEAFGNIYRDTAHFIAARRSGETTDVKSFGLPDVVDGAVGVIFVDAVLWSQTEAGIAQLYDLTRDCFRATYSTMESHRWQIRRFTRRGTPLPM